MEQFRTLLVRQSALGPLQTVVRAAGSGVADSVQGILIHYVDDPTPGWGGGSRGIAESWRHPQSRAWVPGVLNKNSLNGARHPSAALLAPVHTRGARHGLQWAESSQSRCGRVSWVACGA